MKKSYLITILTIIVISIIVASYFLFFYTPSAYKIAEDLNLYTGNLQDDQALNDMIDQALAGGGTISSGNLEWELNDAAQRLASGNVIEESKVNGRVISASALLTSIDTTHDYYNGSPDVENSAAQITEEQIALYDKYIITYGETPEEATIHTNDYYGIDFSQADYEEAKMLLSVDLKPGDEYIPQASLNKLWQVINNLNIIASNPNIIK